MCPLSMYSCHTRGLFLMSEVPLSSTGSQAGRASVHSSRRSGTPAAFARSVSRPAGSLKSSRNPQSLGRPDLSRAHAGQISQELTQPRSVSRQADNDDHCASKSVPMHALPACALQPTLSHRMCYQMVPGIQRPHNIVDLLFTITTSNDELTILRGSWLHKHIL